MVPTRIFVIHISGGAVSNTPESKKNFVSLGYNTSTVISIFGF